MRIRDGDWWMVEHDFQLQRTVWARANPDGSTTYRTDTAIDDTLEANAEMRNAVGKGWKGDWHKVASIPLGLYYDKLHDAVKQDDMGYLSRFLNDGDNAKFRTKEGKV